MSPVRSRSTLLAGLPLLATLLLPCQAGAPPPQPAERTAATATTDAFPGALPARPDVILPEALHWQRPFGDDRLQAAWVQGSETASGPYLLRVRLASGARIPVHRHPDSRSTTVLSGRLWVGFGTEADDGRLVAVPAGAVYIAPAGMPHFIWARDGEVVYQEAGVGPTGTQLLRP